MAFFKKGRIMDKTQTFWIIFTSIILFSLIGILKISFDHHYRIVKNYTDNGYQLTMLKGEKFPRWVKESE